PVKHPFPRIRPGLDRCSFRAEAALQRLDKRGHATAERPLDHDHIPRPYSFHQPRSKLLGGLGVGATATCRQCLVKRSHQLATGKDNIYARPVNELCESLMQFLSLRPKLKHVAKHGDPAAELLPRCKTERCTGRAHRSWIGVVGFIDDGDAPVFATEKGVRAAAGLRPET